MVHVGDIYEHDQYGRGQIVKIYEGYATIAFDSGQRYQYDVRTLMEAEEIDEGILNVASGLTRAGARIGAAAGRAAGKTFGKVKRVVSKAVEAPMNAARKAKAIVGQEIASSEKRTRLNSAARAAHTARKAQAKAAYHAALGDSKTKLQKAAAKIKNVSEELNEAIAEYEYLKSKMED